MTPIIGRCNSILFAMIFACGLITVGARAQPPPTPGRWVAPPPGIPAAPAIQTPEGRDTVVLKVGDQPYTKADLDFLFENLSPQVKQSMATQGRKPVGDQFALVVMLSQQAHSQHLDQTATFEHKLAVQKQQLQAQAAYDEIVQQAKASPDEIKKYYADHTSDYDEIVVRQVVVRKRSSNAQTGPGLAPEEAKTRAEAIHKELAAGTDIKKVAEDFKVPIPTDAKADVIIQTEPQSVRRGGLRPEMEKVAFAL